MARSIRLVCLVGMVLVLLGWLLPVGSASSAAAVQLELLPPTLSLAINESAEVQVLVRNLTTDKLSGLALTSVPNPNLRVVIAANPLVELPANAAGTLNLTVTRLRAAASEDTLYFALSFTRTPKEKDTVSFSDAASQSLKVTSRQPAALENVVTMAVQAGAAPRALVEMQPGRLFLTVTNKSDEILVLGKPVVMGPPFLTFTPGEPGEYTPLPAHSAVNLTIDLAFKPNVAVQTGKHPISFNLSLHTLGSPEVDTA